MDEPQGRARPRWTARRRAGHGGRRGLRGSRRQEGSAVLLSQGRSAPMVAKTVGGRPAKGCRSGGPLSYGQSRLLRSSRCLARCQRGRPQEDLSQARDEVSSGPQSGRHGGRAEVQGDLRGLSRALRQGEAGGLRSFRSCRLRWRKRRPRWERIRLRHQLRPTSSTICSASSWAAVSGGAAGGSRPEVPISATTWRSRWRTPSRAGRRQSAFPAPWAASPATAPALVRARDPLRAGTCGGAGKVRAQQGFFTIERTCPTCQGAGQVIADPCPDCRGAGRVQKEKSPRGEYTDGRRGRHPHPPRRRGRGGPPRCAARRSLHLPLGHSAPHLPAGRDAHSLPRADCDDDGDPRRHGRGADRRRQPRTGPRCRGAPSQGISSVCAARACRRCGAPATATCISRSRSRRRSTSPSVRSSCSSSSTNREALGRPAPRRKASSPRVRELWEDLKD